MKKRNRIFGAIVLVIGLFLYFWSKNNWQPTVESPQKLTEDSIQKFKNIPTSGSSVTKIPTHGTSEQKIIERRAEKLSSEQIIQARADAKAHLASVYTAMASYLAENNRYTTDFQSAGWQPNAAEMKVKIRFVEAFYPNRDNIELSQDEQPERLTSDLFVGKPARSDDPNSELYSYSEEIKNVNLADFKQYCENGCTASDKEFEILAVVSLGGGRFDVWKINQRKMLTQVKDGLASP